MDLPIKQLNNDSGRLGRFELIRPLGEGPQGVVYLAHDPKLDRRVAIKTLLQRVVNSGQLMADVRNVSRLQHPNIIPLYEIGEYNQRPFLVYPFIEGITLRSLLNDTPTLPILRCVGIIREILAGLAYAHDTGIIHRDLSPENIILGSDDTPKIMDFGISTFTGSDSDSGAIIGAAAYLSPELIKGNSVGPGADIFSLGIVAYEMLTGVSIFAADNPRAAMFKVINENVLPPSRRNAAIDNELDRIVMTALEKGVENRYQSTLRMQNDLDLYLQRESKEENSDNNKGDLNVIDSKEKITLGILLRNMTRKKDFPAVARNVSEIMQQSGNNASAGQLAKTILKDQSLTSKLLRMVNSSAYCNFGGEIRTVSRAVVILGMDHIQSLAAGIIVFQHMQNASHAEALKSNACNSFLSALLAKTLAGFTNSIDPEEAFLAAMFHKFGKQLTIYYLPDEYDEITEQIRLKGMKEATAANRVLGMHYTTLGRFVATEWVLPENILKGLQTPHKGVVPKPKTREEILTQVSIFTNEIADIAGSDLPDKKIALERLSVRYKRCFDLSVEKISKLLTLYIVDVREFADTLGIDARSTGFYRNLLRFISPAATELQSGKNVNNHDERILTRGITDVAGIMFNDYELKPVLRRILEIIYQGSGGRRVILLLKDNISNTMQARFGFGDGIDKIMPRIHFLCDKSDDVFNAAVTTHEDIILHEISHSRHRVPDWCQDHMEPDNLILMPIVIRDNCIGILYIDNIKGRLPETIMTYLDTCRHQIATAIKHKTQH